MSAPALASPALEPKGLRLEGRVSRLLPFTAAQRDDPAYLGWLNDHEVVKTLNLPDYLAPVPYAKAAAYCDAMMASEHDLFLALHLRSDDRFVGTLKAGHIDWHAGTADIGILIGERAVWGQGLAADSIHVLARHLFGTVGLRKLTAGSMANNPAMLRVFEKLGFAREGVFRAQDRLGDAFFDHVHFGCFADELRDPASDGGGR